MCFWRSLQRWMTAIRESIEVPVILREMSRCSRGMLTAVISAQMQQVGSDLDASSGALPIVTGQEHTHTHTPAVASFSTFPDVGDSSCSGSLHKTGAGGLKKGPNKSGWLGELMPFLKFPFFFPRQDSTSASSS